MVKYIAKDESNILRKKVYVDYNPVEEFLENNKNVIFSSKHIAKKLNISNKSAIFYANNSDNIVHNKSHEVGSGKHKLNIYSYIS